MPPQQSGKFSLSSNWTANESGEILGAAGHVHDGGTNLAIRVDGVTNCDSKATYAETPEFVEKPGEDAPHASGGHSHAAMKHISSMSQCQAFPVRRMEKGQVWTLEAYYDLDGHDGILDENSEQTEVSAPTIIHIQRHS